VVRAGSPILWQYFAARKAGRKRAANERDWTCAGRAVQANQAILVELKTVRAHDMAHRKQCLNYLRATGKYLCLLMNFGPPHLEVRRVVPKL
jgi:hypothetical protein